MQTSNTFDDLLEKKLAGNIFPEEDALLSKMIEDDPEKKKSYDQMQSLNELTFLFNTKKSFDSAQAFQKFQTSIGQVTEVVKKKAIVSKKTYWLSIAASLLLVSSLSWYFLLNTASKRITHVAVEAKTLEVHLPDGSIVTLNKGSEISYAEDFPMSGRNVTLGGEALFNVVRDEQSPFRVTAGSSITTVLGTSFNIKAFKDSSVKIDIISGKVAFAQKEDQTQKVILEKGDAAMLRKGGDIKKIAGSINAMAWKTKKLSFREATMRLVVNDLENYFKIKFVIEDPKILDCLFTSDFEAPDVYEILEELRITMGLAYERVSEGIRLKGDACL